MQELAELQHCSAENVSMWQLCSDMLLVISTAQHTEKEMVSINVTDAFATTWLTEAGQ